MPNINPYSTYEMVLLSVLYILLDVQFISAGANTGQNGQPEAKLWAIEFFKTYYSQDTVQVHVHCTYSV